MCESSCFLLSHTLKNWVKHVQPSKTCSFLYFKMQLFSIKNITVCNAFICCSVAQLYSTLWNLMDGSMSGFPVFTIFQSLLKLVSIESVMPSIHLILCHPLLLLTLIFPRIRAFSNELALCIRWPKYWSFSFSTNPINEY